MGGTERKMKCQLIENKLDENKLAENKLAENKLDENEVIENKLIKNKIHLKITKLTLSYYNSNQEIQPT
jgi:hypothetical protein